MIKSKAVVGMVAVVLAAFLPAPSAQASELVKLGKLDRHRQAPGHDGVGSQAGAGAGKASAAWRPEGTGELRQQPHRGRRAGRPSRCRVPARPEADV